MGRLGDEIKMLGRMGIGERVGTRRMTEEGTSRHKGGLSSVSLSCFLGKKLFDEKGGGERKKEREREREDEYSPLRERE